MSNQAASVESVTELLNQCCIAYAKCKELEKRGRTAEEEDATLRELRDAQENFQAEVTRLAEQGAAPQAVQAGDAVLRKHVLLMLDGMGEQVNETPSTPSNMVLQKGMRMAIGTAIDRVKSLPGAEESRTFMGEPVASPKPIGFVALDRFGMNKHLFSSFYETRNSEHEWIPVFAARVSPAEKTARMLTVNEFNVGRFCLSEDECIAQGIDFSAYERGIADASAAFSRNT